MLSILFHIVITILVLYTLSHDLFVFLFKSLQMFVKTIQQCKQFVVRPFF